jgi:hypothetical protein
MPPGEPPAIAAVAIAVTRKNRTFKMIFFTLHLLVVV